MAHEDVFVLKEVFQYSQTSHASLAALFETTLFKLVVEAAPVGVDRRQRSGAEGEQGKSIARPSFAE